MPRKTASYVGLSPASIKASTAARASSKKSGTKPELLLRNALCHLGITTRPSKRVLPGRPDFVFTRARVVVFVDGDYWHGRHWTERKKRLASVNNSAYWIAKIEGNRKRDRRTTRALRDAGWTVLRFWETDIKRNADRIAAKVTVHLGD